MRPPRRAQQEGRRGWGCGAARSIAMCVCTDNLSRASLLLLACGDRGFGARRRGAEGKVGGGGGERLRHRHHHHQQQRCAHSLLSVVGLPVGALALEPAPGVLRSGATYEEHQRARGEGEAAAAERHGAAAQAGHRTCERSLTCCGAARPAPEFRPHTGRTRSRGRGEGQKGARGGHSAEISIIVGKGEGTIIGGPSLTGTAGRNDRHRNRTGTADRQGTAGS